MMGKWYEILNEHTSPYLLMVTRYETPPRYFAYFILSGTQAQ